MTYQDILESTISNKKILLIQPGNTLHTTAFTGLNFQDTTKYDEVFNLADYEKIKNTKYDYIFIHGFLGRRIHTILDIHKISEYNISTDELIIDYLGEGYSIPNDIDDLHNNLNIMFSYNKIKLLSPIPSGLENEIENFKNIEFFRYPMAGPRVFCSPYNFMLHDGYKDRHIELNSALNVYGGLSWNDEPKEFSFMCLNNREQPHRNFIVHHLLDKEITNLGIISQRFGDGGLKEYNILDNNSKGFVYPQKIYVKYNQIIPSQDLDVNNKFGPNISIATKTYIDVITETSFTNEMFITEKSMKPFYNLQFPIIFGPIGIIQKLREYGFDMFDDIINHSYDTLDFNTSVKSTNYTPHLNYFLFNKADLISEEVKRLCNLDLHSIYLQNKNRFLKNQELVNNICTDDNNLLYDLGKWLFGDSIEIKRQIEFKKIYL